MCIIFCYCGIIYLCGIIDLCEKVKSKSAAEFIYFSDITFFYNPFHPPQPPPHRVCAADVMRYVNLIYFLSCFKT